MMRIFSLFLFLSFSWGLIYGQIEMDKQTYDFGTVKKETSRIVDFRIKNRGTNYFYLLRSEVPNDISIYYKRTKIEVDSMAYVRIQINPQELGSFQREVALYVSSQNDPIILSINAEIEYFDLESEITCPDFSLKKPHVEPEMTVSYSERVPLVKEEYQKDLKVDSVSSVIDSFPVSSKPEPNANEELPSNLYKPNNVVFLIDVSSSMAKRERLELLKIAVRSMIEVLRTYDRVAIVTYSNAVKQILPSTPGANKDTMIAMINSLSAKGLTAGEKGIKTAYEIARNNFIKEGNNQIILVTDGAFNVEVEGYDLMSDIRKNTRAGIILSVLAIKHAKVALESLTNIVRKGKGNFLKIGNQQEAENVLINELKNNSLITAK